MQLGHGARWALGALVICQLLLAGEGELAWAQGSATPPAVAPPAAPWPASPPPAAAPASPPPAPSAPAPSPTAPSPVAQPTAAPPPADPAAATPTAASSPSQSSDGAPGTDEAAVDSAAKDAPAERRSGFTFGISAGLLTGGARGYPNDIAKIGVAEYRTETGVGVSSGGTLWLGGSLADWLNVGIGIFGGGFERNGLRLSSAAFQARIELFPLFYRGGDLRDLGLLLTAGTGATIIERGGESVAEGAGTSAVGAGIFYEPWRWWQLTFGPQLEYMHQFSDSIRAHTFVVGVRTAFYGGP